MRTVVVVLLAAGLGVSSAFLVACGDRNALIPKGDAAAMRSDLDQAATLYSQEECRKAEAKVTSARGRADRLPPQVDAGLRSTLADNLDHALAQVTAQCGKTTSTQTTATTATTATTPTTATTQTTTTHTTTTHEPPPTQSTSTSNSNPTPPPSNPGGSGGTPPSNSGGASG